MFAYAFIARSLLRVLFSENYPRGSAGRQSVGMTGATMQIPNHYFRMFAMAQRVCVCARARPTKEIRARSSVSVSEMRGTALNPAKSLTRPSISVNASCVLSALAFFRRSFDVHRSQLISGARRPCIMMSRARAVFSRYTCESRYLSLSLIRASYYFRP